MPIVSLDSVHKIYPLGKTEVHAVKGVSFDIEKGDFISIAGPSGSGKSTILNMIGCIDTPSEGDVNINGQSTSGLPDKQITNLRHETLGFIFQSFNLIPVLNIYENIEFPLLLGNKKNDKKESAEWINTLIEEAGLQEWRTHKPNELSGGQRQRVAIARALVTKPEIVLADEPTANLDSVTSDAIIRLMKKINKDFDTTFIFSTHDPSIVGVADHIIRLRDGMIEENNKKAAGAAV
ncbi:MAG: ABC transporter ATP-binding protein [Spirochaetales bacterium]|uniref:ABC transporter ATP-binding protein n=1 Tax=Candidatus Thalassospirochaeta sargassi TaxID=3119039 RepID=A0AAJ1MNY4_9SPIO|nr:ABC transporter ATP-binding protein [Spirochaetales bacterium]